MAFLYDAMRCHNSSPRELSMMAIRIIFEVK